MMMLFGSGVNFLVQEILLSFDEMFHRNIYIDILKVKLCTKTL